MNSEPILSQTSMPPTLRFFCFATLVFCVAMFVAEQFAVNTFHLDRVPYNRMTLDEGNDLADIKMFPVRFQHFGTPEFFDDQWGSPFLYPAPLALIYKLFYLSSNYTVWYLCTSSFLFLVGGVLFFVALRKRGLSFDSAMVFAGATVLLSYPIYFTLNRANLEVFVWVFSGLGVLLFLKDRYWLAATLIGCAGACKFYPFFYLGLFVSRKKLWQALYALGVGAVLNLVSTYAVTGNLASGREGISDGLDAFRQTYVLHRRYLEIGLDHSIFGFLKRVLNPMPAPEQTAKILTVYLVAAAVLVLLLFLLRVRKLPVINQVLFITVACLTLPPLSSDYTLLHLYTPWVMLALLAAETWRRDRSTPEGLWPMTLCLAILLSSQTEIIFHGERLNGQIKCITLLVLGTCAVMIPILQPCPSER